jgi:hypothetical protein
MLPAAYLSKKLTLPLPAKGCAALRAGAVARFKLQ